MINDRHREQGCRGCSRQDVMKDINSGIPDESQKAIDLSPAGSSALNQATCVMSFHRQMANEKPDSFGGPFDYPIESDEDVYQRRYKIGEEAKPIDVGFVEKPSLIVIANTTKWESSTIPTDEQKRDIAKRAVMISFGGSPASLIVLPGRSQPLFVVCDPKTIQIRSFYKEANVAVFVVPE